MYQSHRYRLKLLDYTVLDQNFPDEVLVAAGMTSNKKDKDDNLCFKDGEHGMFSTSFCVYFFLYAEIYLLDIL